MEFKGTKGKWGIDSENNVIDYLGDEIAFCPEWRTTTKANALLMSKAPEMLEMLIDILDTNRNLWGECESRAYQIEEIKQLIQEATEL